MSAGLTLGLLTGLLLQRTQFCTMGALSDFFLFGSWRRLRILGVAISVAILCTQYLIMTGQIDLSQTHYLSDTIQPTALLLGGIFFGWGMVLAGGCASRTLVRAGAGSLKAWTALLVMIMTASAAMSGPFAWAGSIASLGLDVTFLPATLPAIIGMLAAFLAGTAALTIQMRAKQWIEAATGLALGLIVSAAWPLSMAYIGQIPPAPEAINFVSSSSILLLWLIIDKLPNFGAALMMGTIVGAFSASMMLNSFRLEGFSSKADTGRHMAGGLLMGLGGALAIGCTFGQGVSGLATLSLGSMIAVAGIVAGARLGLYQLETGGILAMLTTLKRGGKVTAAGKDA